MVHFPLRMVMLLVLVGVLGSSAWPTTTRAQDSTPSAQFRVYDLGTLGGEQSDALGINNYSAVVGESVTSDGQVHAFLWSNKRMHDLAISTDQVSIARAINHLYQIVGAVEVANGETHAFLRSRDLLPQDLGTLGGRYSSAASINAHGQVVGESHITSGRFRAFLWQNPGPMQDLGTLPFGANSFATGINVVSQVAGTSDTDTGAWHAFRWWNGRMKDLGTLGGGSSWATGINDGGQVVGESEVALNKPTRHAFLWSVNRGMQDLGTIGAWSSRASSINDVGTIVGTLQDEGKGGFWAVHAFIWQDGRMHDLNDLIPRDSGWELIEARAINDRNEIVGYGRIDGQVHAFLLTP